jgi:hypothetical protein
MTCLTWAIDYDGTYTADPALFRSLIRFLKGHAQEVVIVTNRHATGPLADEVREAIDAAFPTGLPVQTWGGIAPAWAPQIVFAGNSGKREALARHGVAAGPVIWVDDMPETVALIPALAFLEGLPGEPEDEVSADEVARTQAHIAELRRREERVRQAESRAESLLAVIQQIAHITEGARPCTMAGRAYELCEPIIDPPQLASAPPNDAEDTDRG